MNYFGVNGRAKPRYHPVSVDMLAVPETSGGTNHAADCLAAHAKCSIFKRGDLVRYAEPPSNGGIFKRLGLLSGRRERGPRDD